MTAPYPVPICAFSVTPDGKAAPLEAANIAGALSPKSGYAWLHFDLADPALAPWLYEVLPFSAAAAMAQSETRPRCDHLEDGTILNLRGVNLNPGADPDDMVSLRLWVSDGLILSTRARKIWAVDAIRQRMRTGEGPPSIPAFLCDLAYGLTKRIETVSLELVEKTDELEEGALDPTRSLTADLAHQRHSVIKMRRFMRPQSEAVSDLAASQNLLVDAHHGELMRETANRTLRTIEELDATADRLQAIQDHLDMLHASALGRNSYVLSVVAAIFLPLGFLTGLFGINVGGMPFVESDLGFWGVTLGSLFLGIILFLVFRLLKWL